MSKVTKITRCGYLGCKRAVTHLGLFDDAGVSVLLLCTTHAAEERHNLPNRSAAARQPSFSRSTP